MAKGSRSKWYRTSIRVINEAIAAHPPCESAKELRRLLGEHYPFGSREHHPYKMWCRAVKDTVAAHFGRPKLKQPPVVRIDPIRGVLCGWCEGKNCIACVSARQKWAGASLEILDRWTLWYPAAQKDEAQRLILSDWLEDQGFDEEAKHLRELGCVKLKKSKPTKEQS